MRSSVLRREMPATEFVPYVQHVAEGQVLLDDGSRIAMFSVKGRQAETADPEDVQGWMDQLNMFLRTIASDRVILTTHLVRRSGDDFTFPKGELTGFARHLDDSYRRRMVRRLYRNELFVTVQVRPAAQAKPGLMDLLLRRPRKDDGTDQGRKMRGLLEELARGIEQALEPYGVRRLGVRLRRGVLYSEIAEALALVLTGIRRSVPLPLANGRLGHSIYTDRCVAEWDTLRLRGERGVTYAAVLGLREYPAATVPGQFGVLLAAPYHFVLTQSFGFLAKTAAMTVLSRKQNQMTSVSDRAFTQRDELAQAANDLESNDFVMGTHHLSMMVMADSRSALADVAAAARTDLADSGAVVAREDIALEAAYWAQLPGNAWLRPRPPAVTSRNFAGMAPLHGYPEGPERGYWDAPLTVFRSSGGTPYRYHLHVGDLGNTAMFGPSGSGKTTLLLFMLAQCERLGAQVVFFDKDRGGEILARAVGGTYLVLPSGEPTGMAPLRALDASPANQEFLCRWVASLICATDYDLLPDDERRIAQGIEALMRLPPGARSLAELRAFLGQADQAGAGARLERWCRGRALGWAFDGTEDRVRTDAPFIGFDMTALLDDPAVRGPAMAYLSHRIEEVVDGRRIVVAIDEFWKALEDEAFRDLVNDKLKTIRKRNGALILATQSPRDALRSPIAHTLIEQCPTQILMPNPRADAADYRDGLKLTEPEYRLVREDLNSGGRRFLLKQGTTSVACDLDLTGEDELIAVLSGRESTVRLLQRVCADVGDDPADWLPVFRDRLKEAAA